MVVLCQLWLPATEKPVFNDDLVFAVKKRDMDVDIVIFKLFRYFTEEMEAVQWSGCFLV